MSQLAAYLAYAVGSTLFLALAVTRGAPLLALGSACFLVGTLLLLASRARRARARSRDGSCERRPR